MSGPDASRPAPPAPRWWRSEDWLALLAALVLIAALFAGWRPLLPKLGWSGPADLARALSVAHLGALGLLGLALLPLAAGACVLQGARAARVAAGYVVIFLLAVAALALAEQASAKAWGLEYVIFALLLGLALNHAGLVPGWVREAARSELYVKTGLVLLGGTIVFGELLQAGALGLVQSLLVVLVVWQVAFRLCRRLRVDDGFAVILSSAVAICGVSAAIAACGAIRGDRRQLSYTTSLVLVCAVPMMILMPWAVRSLGIPELVGGAWMGGTLDTTASVTAAAAQISEPAMKLGTIVKFSQNVLMGAAAFVISVWWALRPAAGGAAERPTARVIWERFPKFVLGFLAASLAFSFLVDPATVKALKPSLNALRNVWFALAFVSIGLETRVTELLRLDGGRPALAFGLAQAFNVVWTLLLAWLFFGGRFFPVPEFR